ncbi:MAG: NAD(P)-binding domain-containing protein [Rhodothermales bacterium]
MTRIAVIGTGSSGLVTLKYLRDAFPEADLVAFERGHTVRGCWGDPGPDFISTSTKYTTQFSCFRQWTPEVGSVENFDAFYRGGEFGDYLEAFAEHFDLYRFIRFGTEVQHLAWQDDHWQLEVVTDGEQHTEHFDAVFLCTGLANRNVPHEPTHIPVAEDPDTLRNSTVVVVGGGESATGLAHQLAEPERGNTVYLSLRSGMRVSPRYHPIRGVPSDYLRNRLLLSFSKATRNAIGEGFVTFRIRFVRLLERWFPHREARQATSDPVHARRRLWDLKLKARAKGGLFNVFHNKSDAFLEDVAEARLHIIGPPTDDTWTRYHDFDRTTTQAIQPDALVWATGYRSRLEELSEGTIQLKDFYRGCIHSSGRPLYLIGFARPIIGNIPAISEMQARYAAAVLAGTCALPSNLEAAQAQAWVDHQAEYATIDTTQVYPVEQDPYCDLLARDLGILPTRQRGGSWRTWWKLMRLPASTMYYADAYFDADAIQRQHVYTPPVLIGILVLLTLVALPRRLFCKLRRPASHESAL